MILWSFNIFLPGFTGSSLVLLGYGLYWVPFGFIDWVVLGLSGLYWNMQGFTGFS